VRRGRMLRVAMVLLQLVSPRFDGAHESLYAPEGGKSLVVP
jgi:hypothetical protein